jgi:CCR4-NOT transcription complex subunit 2
LTRWASLCCPFLLAVQLTLPILSQMMLNHTSAGSKPQNLGSSSQTAPSPSPPPSTLQTHQQPRPPSQGSFPAYSREDGSNGNSTTDYRNQQMGGQVDPSAPLTKPVQQLQTSPVDKWGLAALLRLIRTGGNSDLLALTLGEDLANIGLDMNGSA